MIHRISHTADATRAFTLVELMIVIAMIVLLIALLMPALGQARATVRQATCASNLHQMGLMLRSYAADTGNFPTYTFNGYDFGYWWSSVGCSMWQRMLPGLAASGYLQNIKVGYCTESDQTLLCPNLKGYFWRPNHDAGENHGDYLYNGPGVHPRYWYGAEISPRLTWGEFPGMSSWAGIHASGKVMQCGGNPQDPMGNYQTCIPTHYRNTTWSGKRVPIMGDSKVLDLNWTVSGGAHFPKPTSPLAYDVNKGIGNVLFTDGSVENYPYSY